MGAYHRLPQRSSSTYNSIYLFGFCYFPFLKFSDFKGLAGAVGVNCLRLLALRVGVPQICGLPQRKNAYKIKQLGVAGGEIGDPPCCTKTVLLMGIATSTLIIGMIFYRVG